MINTIEKGNILGPDLFFKEAVSRKEELEKCLKYLDLGIKTAPEGMLRISKSRSRKQYYQRMGVADKCGIYLGKDQYSLAKGLAQKDYNEKMRRALQRDLDALNVFLRNYNPRTVFEVFEKISDDRKELINPIMMTDEEYAKWWLSVEYEGLGFKDKDREYYTDAGVRVRSKSEILIGNKLEKYGVPYRYEYPIILWNGKIRYPDFYCLNVRTREEIILEHFGKMGNLNYAKGTIEKLDWYSRSGYLLGKNLLATFENLEMPLNVRMIDELIETFLL